MSKDEQLDYSLLLPTQLLTSDKLADTAGDIALYNFEWRFLTLVLLNSSLLHNIELFVKAYPKSILLSKGTYYPLKTVCEKTRQFVLFGTDIANIDLMLSWMQRHKFDNTGKYIVVCVNKSEQDCNETKALKRFWHYKITNVIFMKSTGENGIAGYTNIQSEGNCEMLETVKLETFDFCVHNQSLESCVDAFPEKFRNFYSCPIVVSTFNQTPYMDVSDSTGIDGDVLKIIAESLNARLEIITPKIGSGWGFINNGVWYGSLRDIYDDLANFSMTSAALTLARYNDFQISVTYNFITVSWVTCPADMIPPSFKILYPFDYTSLTLLVLSFLLLITASLIIKASNCNIKRISLLQPTTIVFSSFTICIGMPLSKVPKQSFLLYMIMIWILYCFIVRAFYQAYLISSLKTNKYYPEIKSFAEVIERQYSFGGGLALRDYYVDYPFIYNNWVSVNSDDFFPALVNLSKGKKFALAMSKETAKSFLKNTNNIVNIIPETIVTSPTGLFFKKFSPLIVPINRILTTLIESGIIDKFSRNYTTVSFSHENKSEKKPLTTKHFTGCYVILAVGYTLSLLIFLSEFFRSKIFKRTL